jgi:hypothetical protein
MALENVSRLKLGERAKDTISGFTGIVFGITYYMTGCTKVYLEPTKLDKDGKTMDGCWFDEQRVVPVKGAGFKAAKDATATSGGPMPLPPK